VPDPFDPDYLVEFQAAQEREQQLREEQLSAQYATSLSQELIADSTNPSFNLKPLYDVISYDDAQIAACEQLTNQAAFAINALDVTQLTAALKNSAVPLRISHIQQTLKRRWEWLKLNESLFFYNRVMRLFTAFQKTFFYAHCITAFRHANASNITALNLMTTYQRQFLPNVTYEDNTLCADAFIQGINTPANRNIKLMLDHLAKNSAYQQFKTAPHRQFRPNDTTYLFSLFFMQLRSPAVKNAFGTYLQETLIDDLHHLQIPYSENGLNPQDSYPKRLADHYKILLDTSEKKLHDEFLTWLTEIWGRALDIASFDLIIKGMYSKPVEQGSKLASEQVKANAIMENQEITLSTQERLNVSLEHHYFFVFDDGKNISNPLLHLALKQYAIAQNSADKATALACAELLIGRGCSPYTKNLFRGNPECKSQMEQNAFDYALIQPDWVLLTLTLKSMITRSHLAELVRLELLTNCEYMLDDTRWVIMKAITTHEGKRYFLHELGILVQALHEASQKFSDLELIIKITEVCEHNNSMIAASLKKVLQNILLQKNDNLLFAGASRNYLGAVGRTLFFSDNAAIDQAPTLPAPPQSTTPGLSRSAEQD
jgi:hypothetical protein